MKKFFSLFVYGASIHPGNEIYVVLIVIAGAALSNNQGLGYIKGFLCGGVAMAILLLPLYVYSSYMVGKANKKAPNPIK